MSISIIRDSIWLCKRTVFALPRNKTCYSLYANHTLLARLTNHNKRMNGSYIKSAQNLWKKNHQISIKLTTNKKPSGFDIVSHRGTPTQNLGLLILNHLLNPVLSAPRTLIPRLANAPDSHGRNLIIRIGKRLAGLR